MLINLKLPASARAKVIYHVLYDLDERGDCPPEDIALIALPDGRFIDVGFFAEEGSQGSYMVTVYRDKWDNRSIERWLTDPNEVARTVRQFVIRFSGDSTAETKYADGPLVRIRSGSRLTMKGQELQDA